MTDGIELAVEELGRELAAHGYEKTGGHGSKGFGDEVTCYSFMNVSVRVVRDRGQWFFEASPTNGADWFDADLWHACLTNEPAPVEPRSASIQAHLLTNELADLTETAQTSPMVTLERLRALRRARSRRRIGIDTGESGS
ncbi:hypothetical protein G1H11_17695 [Phytoactinopolyspora alkaliphila]|uniref:DUF4304 domain-containing protein n=1 Tax=Phytoactinopolyspora alkaliphila TaxID=1783498 RepID=A0A6N9YQB5_9ACTN|nr:hypothetical protein [Phytoactinopolyspora alkaliphila]NED97135.1 hypothetical protein [Phytoactinopolyspora alkaliphila]